MEVSAQIVDRLCLGLPAHSLADHGAQQQLRGKDANRFNIPGDQRRLKEMLAPARLTIVVRCGVPAEIQATRCGGNI
jgi:hypothetical protein